nr:MAG TPA: Initiation-control protein YabA, DnaA, DnaN, Zinc finger.7A [Caudoviricetes sp.]
MNYREKIRKAIECPQFGNTNYGEWGTLRLDQRKYIKRLLDELDSADAYILQLYEENQQLKEQLNKKYENVGTLTSEILYEENTKLVQENQQLKEQLEASEKARKNCYEYLKNPPEDVWSGHSLEKAKELLDIDKGE